MSHDMRLRLQAEFDPNVWSATSRVDYQTVVNSKPVVHGACCQHSTLHVVLKKCNVYVFSISLCDADESK